MIQADTPLYNSRTIDIYLRLLKAKYPYVHLEKVLSYSGMKAYEVADPGHWFTQEQIDLFYSKLVEETGNPNLAREAGKYSGSPDAGWSMQGVVFGFLTCAKVFDVIGMVTPKLTRSSNWHSRALAHNSVEITVTLNPGAQEKPYQCESRMGYIEAIPKITNNVAPTIEHTECIFKGGSCCRYLVSWPQPMSHRLNRLRNYLTVFFLGMLAVGLATAPLFSLHTGLPIALCLLLFMSLRIEKEDKRDLAENMSRLRVLADQWCEQVNVNYGASAMTNELGKAIVARGTPDDVLQSLINNLQNKLKYDRGFVLLLTPDGRHLHYRTGYGYTEAQTELLQKLNFSVESPNPKEVFSLCLKEMRSFILEKPKDISAKTDYWFEKVGAKSVVACPILHEETALGVLVVESLDRPLLQSDVNLLMGIAPVIGLSITNAEAIASRERQMTSILEALAATIDARDPLTAGHSIRVTEYAVGICRELGMPRGYTEMVRVAALLHDYGKVGVPDEILKKNGQLSPEEFAVVRTHAAKTREILDRINFEGVFRQVPMVAEAHHEKMDGTGYPHGLKGKEIPMGARIIAVADFFEALNSKRHYRDPMPITEILELLHDGRGTHFDPRVVDAFINYWRGLEAESLRALDNPPPLVSNLIYLKNFISV